MTELIGRDAAWQTAEERLASDLTVSEQRALVLRSALLHAAFLGHLTGASTDTGIIEELAGA